MLLTMQEPTDPMRAEAASTGYYVSLLRTKHPKMQILTIAELLRGKKIDYPSQGVNVTFEKAPREKKRGVIQGRRNVAKIMHYCTFHVHSLGTLSAFIKGILRI